MREAKVTAGFWGRFYCSTFKSFSRRTAQTTANASGASFGHFFPLTTFNVLGQTSVLGNVLSQNHLVDEYITLNNDEDDQLSELSGGGGFRLELKRRTGSGTTLQISWGGE